MGIVPGCGQVLLGEPLSVPLGDMVVSADASFYAGKVGGPLTELLGCLLRRDAELLPEGPEVGDVRSCDRVEYLAIDFPRDVAFEAAHGFPFALAVGDTFGNIVFGSVVRLHAREYDVVEGAVGLAVTTSAESVTVGLAG